MAKLVTPHVPGVGPTSGIQDVATRQALRPIMDAHNTRNGAGEQGFVTRDELRRVVEVLKSDMATVKVTPEVLDAMGVPLKQNVKTYTVTDLKRDLANGIESILASAGPDFRLWVDNTGAKIEIGHKDLVYAGYSAVADTTNTRLPGLAITAGGIAMGYNDVDGQWVDAVAIEAATGSASFAGTVNALYGNFAEGITIGTTGVTLGDLAAGSYTTDDLKADLATGVEGVLAGLGTNYRMVLDANGVFFSHKDAIYNGTATPANGLTAVAVTANGVAMGYNHPTTGAWTNAVAISATGDVTIAGTLKASSVIEASATIQGHGTIGGIAADADQAAADAAAAVAAVGDKLNRSASDVLTGQISLSSSGGFKIGTIAWDAAGNITSGTGLAITAKGLVGAQSGSATFSIGVDGSAYYGGNVGAGQITAGTITAASLSTTGYGAFYGQIPSAITIAGQSMRPTVLGASPNGDIGVAGKTTSGHGVFGAATTGTGVRGASDSWYGVWGSTDTGQAVRGAANAVAGVGVHGRNSAGGIGVEGYAAGASGIGVRAQHASADGTALSVVGKMTISSATLVSNLNADLLDGNHASAFALTSHTHSIYPSQFHTQSGTGNISSGSVYFYTSTGLTAYQFFSDGGGSVGMRSVSDAKLKQDVVPETLGLDFINALLPVQYRMKSDPSVRHHGFVAQDVGPLIEGVDSLKYQYADGVKGMDYLALIAPLVKAVQELTAKVQALEAQNNG